MVNSIGAEKVYFCIMSNLFGSDLEVHDMYDLKGSTYKRELTTEQLGYIREKRMKIAMKDNDFTNRNVRLKFNTSNRDRVLAIIQNDVDFFKKNKIIDYSFLVGIHKKSKTGDPNRTEEILRALNEGIGKHNGVFPSIQKDEIYYIGIIDILNTSAWFRKKIEYYWKRAIYGNGISCIPADQYGDRFLKFISQKVFKE